MNFEDLKLPDWSGPYQAVAIHTARAIYDQMREHYEADKQSAPEWRLPDPPPGSVFLVRTTWEPCKKPKA